MPQIFNHKYLNCCSFVSNRVDISDIQFHWFCLINGYIYLPELDQKHLSNVFHQRVITQNKSAFKNPVWFSTFFDDIQKAPNTKNDPVTFLYFYYSSHGTIVCISIVSFRMSQLWTIDRWSAPDHRSVLMMSQLHGDQCRFTGVYTTSTCMCHES